MSAFYVVLQRPNGHCETSAGPNIEMFDTEEQAKDKASEIALRRKCPIVVMKAVWSVSAEVALTTQEYP